MSDSRSVGGWLAAPFWNTEEKRLRALWRLVGFGLVAAALTRLAAAAGLVGRLQGGNPALASFTGLVLALASLWITARLLERRPLADSGLRFDGPSRREIGIGLLLGALLMAGIFATEVALGWVEVKGLFRSGDPGAPFALAFLTPLLVFVCVGIYEEAVFRGFLTRTLAEGLSCRWVPPRTALVVAAVLSAALFGFGHRNNPNATLVSTLNIAVAGIFLALPYLLTARLALPIGLHIAWNLFQGSIFGFPVSGLTTIQTTLVAIDQHGPPAWTGGSFGPEAGLLGLLAMGAGSVAVFLLLRDRGGRAVVQEVLAAPPARPAHPPLAPPSEPDRLTA
jgi:membrane protease YdiL (CAAX protease family)